MTNHIASVDLLRGGLRVGEPRSGGGLTLVPLFGGAPAGEYLLGAEAFGAGLLHITEKDDGQVPEILADNRAGVPVLLLDGRAPRGRAPGPRAQRLGPPRREQDDSDPGLLRRAGALGVLGSARLRPGGCAVRAPGAAGAEGADGSGERPRRRAVPRRPGRGLGGGPADGRAPWRAPSATGRLGDYIRERRGSLDAIVAAFPRPEEGKIGVVACIGGRPVAVDVFDRPEVLAKVWTRLVGGYATDALGVQRREVRREAAERFLRDAAAGEATSHEGVGLGMQVLVTSPQVVVTAFTWERGVVHLAVLAAPGTERTGDRPIASPRARARRWFHS